jgi:hypothetical protein
LPRSESQAFLGLPPSHQFQLLSSAPTFNLLLQFPGRFAGSAALAPNQFNRPALRGVSGSNAPVMPLHPLFYVICNSDVERIISAPHHVAEPNCCVCHRATRFCSTLRPSASGQPGVLTVGRLPFTLSREG